MIKDEEGKEMIRGEKMKGKLRKEEREEEIMERGERGTAISKGKWNEGNDSRGGVEEEEEKGRRQ